MGPHIPRCSGTSGVLEQYMFVSSVPSQLDLLESVALIQTILYLVCGILFESQPRFSVDEYNSLVSGEYLSIIALCSCIFVLVLGCILCIGEIFDVRDSKMCAPVLTPTFSCMQSDMNSLYALLRNTQMHVFSAKAH